MKLSWSHAVMYVRDYEKMIDFYSQVLEFAVTDQGPINPSPGAPQIVFLSQEPEEHHQLAMIANRQDDSTSNSINHFAFRVAEYESVTRLAVKLRGIEGIKVAPLCHGNTLSIYFNDPEGNGIEVFWDTPWHVPQPQGKRWDTSLSEQAALDWVESAYADEKGFVPREDYYAPRRQETRE